MTDLGDARVLLIGAGGLGSPAALYLAAAGIGTMGIIDSDSVDLSNLQRQILHRTRDVGRSKVESARAALLARHPHLHFVGHAERFEVENALEIVRGYDLVVDGSDNFRTKFLANDAAVLARRPLVHGGILRWSGQLFVVLPGESACYRCIFEAPPPPGEIPSCEEAGVVGAVAGVVGTLLAVEAIKVLTAKGRVLANRILTYDALASRLREVEVRRNPRCAVCGPSAVIRALRPEHYLEGECNVPAQSHRGGI